MTTKTISPTLGAYSAVIGTLAGLGAPRACIALVAGSYFVARAVEFLRTKHRR